MPQLPRTGSGKGARSHRPQRYRSRVSRTSHGWPNCRISRSPLSRGSGCAAGRGAGGEGCTAHKAHPPPAREAHAPRTPSTGSRGSQEISSIGMAPPPPPASARAHPISRKIQRTTASAARARRRVMDQAAFRCASTAAARRWTSGLFGCTRCSSARTLLASSISFLLKASTTTWL